MIDEYTQDESPTDAKIEELSMGLASIPSRRCGVCGEFKHARNCAANK